MLKNRVGMQRGFTIVELLIVVVVIAILAAVTLVAYTGIRESATASLIQGELAQNLKTLQIEYVRGGDLYPDASFASTGIQVGTSSTASYEPAADRKSFCLHIANQGQVFRLTSTDNAPVAGLCSSQTPSIGTIASTSFTVSWTASAGADSYNVNCARDAAFTVGSSSRSVATTTANFSGLQAGTTHYCRVQALLGATTGPWSTTTSGSTSAPAVPAGLAASSLTSTSFTTTWTAVSGVVGYTVQCARDSGYTTGLVTQNPASATQAFSSLQAGTTHYCRVLARGGSLNSAYSANITPATSAPAVPGTLASSLITQTSFTFSWAAVSGVVGYTAQCATDTAYTLDVVTNSTIPAGTTSYAVTGRTANTANYCRVLSRGGSTNSANSANLTITTLP